MSANPHHFMNADGFCHAGDMFEAGTAWIALYAADTLAKAWDEGFKQGGPMHDENYDDPDAHTRNPYRVLPPGK